MIDRRAKWQIDQGAKCSCLGHDDYCPCQNVDRSAPAMTTQQVGERREALIERSRYIFNSYDSGQDNVHDKQLLRDCIAFILALSPFPGDEDARGNQGVTGVAADAAALAASGPSPAVSALRAPAANAEAEVAFDWLPIMWPFGHGVLATAYGVERGIGILVVQAIPDGFTRDEGGTATTAWAAALDKGAPKIALTFNDAAAARLFADEVLNTASAIEAAAAVETAQTGSAEGESAVPQADAQTLSPISPPSNEGGRK